MKQICKRLSVIFLALTIISGSVLTTGIVVNADTYREIYKEDFNSYEKKTSGSANANAMKANGWTAPDDTQPYMSNTQGNYNTGAVYEIPHNKGTSICVAYAKNASQWTDYSVQATMTLLPHKDAAGITRAGVTGRQYVVDNNTGYDLVVIKNEVTDKGATIQLRCDGKMINEAKIPSLENDVAFTLRLEFRGTKLYGYLDNKLMVSKETANDEVKYSAGWAGIRKTDSKGYGVRYDDFIVSEIVPGTYPEGYLYHTNFEEAVLAEAEDPFGAIGFISTSKNKIENKEVQLAAGGRAYLTKVVGSLDWEDYTVEAKVQIIKNESDTATKGNAGIIARSSNENQDGYEFSMNYSGSTRKVTLTKRNGKTSALGEKAYPFEFNKYYTLTMTVQGDNIMCYINDELVFDVEDKDAVTYATGYAGFRSTGQTADKGYLNGKIDDFSVKKYQAPTVVYPDGYFYFNDFETNARLKNEGWLREGTKTDGTYVLDGNTNNYLTGVKDSDTWTDYVVEADVMINDDGTLPQYAGIVGRATGARTDGYELILVKEEDTGNTVVRLYKRGVSSGKINDKINKVNVTWEPGKMNTLKMVLKGADIYCYYNDEIVFELTDEDPYLTGYAGVISATGTATSTYDNYAVREIQPTDYPADAVYPQGYLYYNNFSALRAMNKEGWRSDGDKFNGAYVLEAEKYNYLTNVEGSKEWTDYVVEADVTLHDNGEYPQYTGIAARSKDLRNEGYELRLITEEAGTHVRLYKRGIDSGKINDKVNKINVSAIPNEKHTLKMVVEGATITCYFDGVKMFEVTDQNDPYLSGYAGVHSPAGTADSSFEYFAVRQIGDADVVKDAVIKKQDGDIWFYDNFMGEESMTERGWSTDKVAIRNGSAFVTTRVVADKIQDADKWTDYEVSAIVYVDKEAGIHGTATSGASAIVARSLSSTSGYEFGILTSGTSTSYLRLFDRKTGLNIGEDKTTKITAGEHELRMVCIGKEIYCYFDGSLVIAVQSDSWAAGYAGMRSANVDSYYKDFTVRKARPVSTTIRPSAPVSPVTGDAGMDRAVIYGAAMVLSLSMIGFVVTATYSRKKR